VDGKKILLVEDDEIIRMVLDNFFQKAGWTTYLAGNGVEGLEFVTSKNDIEVIVTDIMMPMMDGKTMSSRIREIPRYQNTPILAITAGNLFQEMNGDFYPFNVVFEKPILLKHLHAKILDFF
jgi:CheY-like chemotaxis protein